MRQQHEQAFGATRAGFPWLAMSAVIGAVGAYALTIGYTYPALTFNLEARGYSTSVIGLQAAMSGLGVIVGSAASPWIIVRFGAWRSTVVSILLTVTILATFGLITSVAAWYPLRFFLGTTASILFVVSETWVNQLAPERFRGRLVGVYTSIVAGMFALGPLLIPEIGFSGALPFAFVAGILLVLGSPLFLMQGRLPDAGPTVPGAFRAAMLAIPVLLFAVACFGYFDAALLGLWAVYALGNGVDADWAAYLLTAVVIGNVIFQFPIGWLADHMSRRKLLVACAGVGLIGAVLLPSFDLNIWLTVAFLVVWGALSFGTYTVALTIIGEKLTGAHLVAANAWLSIMWGVGALLGAGLTGVAMDFMGNIGFCVSIAVVYGLLVATCLLLPPVRARATG